MCPDLLGNPHVMFLIYGDMVKFLEFRTGKKMWRCWDLQPETWRNVSDLSVCGYVIYCTHTSFDEEYRIIFDNSEDIRK